MITFDRDPEDYKHWKIEVADQKATILLDVSEKESIKPGYELKLNSYDLGVDIELNDIIQRIRFENPRIKVVIISSNKEKNFCAGANIYMLGNSDLSWKVNFCKFTNETRNGFEDSSNNGSIKFIAAINGACAGGGYEVALACDEILLIDDRSSTVSLPEVPLLGVLPGTGGVTRLIDKRNVRRDIADLFCTNSDGIRGKKTLEWGLVDHIAPPSEFSSLIDERVSFLSKKVKLRNGEKGIKLKKIKRKISQDTIKYESLDIEIDRKNSIASFNILGPKNEDILNLEEILRMGCDWWPLKLTRDLDDAILLLRTNELNVGIITIKSFGDIDLVLKISEILLTFKEHWFINEILGFYRRTLSRFDVSSRSIFTIVENKSCFAGILAEFLFSADRSYMLNNVSNNEIGPFIVLSELNFNSLEMVNGMTRLETRFYNNKSKIRLLENLKGKKLDANDSFYYSLVTIIPDELDWNEEIRISLEERGSFSPDALSGLEANLRFPGKENYITKIFGRLSAWQNWIFNRPNAVSEKGALKLFGTGSKAKLDKKRV